MSIDKDGVYSWFCFSYVNLGGEIFLNGEDLMILIIHKKYLLINHLTIVLLKYKKLDNSNKSWIYLTKLILGKIFNGK